MPARLLLLLALLPWLGGCQPLAVHEPFVRIPSDRVLEVGGRISAAVDEGAARQRLGRRCVRAVPACPLAVPHAPRPELRAVEAVRAWHRGESPKPPDAGLPAL